MKFIIPGELTDLNTYINAERSHKMKAAQIKKSETERVAWHLQDAPSFHKPIYLVIHYYVPNRRKDPDNITFAKKFILDGMVLAGVIPNDGWKNIAGWQEYWIVDASNPRVEVRVSTSVLRDLKDGE